MNMLWAEIKRKTLLRYLTIERAFRAVDTSGDGSIQFLEFNILMKNIGINLDNRAGQMVFQKASAGDREVSLEDFQSTLMAPTLKVLKSLLECFKNNRQKIHGHVNTFIRRVALASERNRRKSLYRFQKKLGNVFCVAFWGEMKKLVTRTRQREIDFETFRGVLSRVQHVRFQAHEVDYFKNLFEAVD